MKQVVIILDNIRSVHNVGSIFRTADGFGVSKLYLCATTPTPIDRFGRWRKDVAKVALGAEQETPWEYVKTTEEALQKLQEEGYEIISVEQTSDSVSCKDVEYSGKIAFVFGNEVEGISKDVLTKSDQVIEIPMKGKKESFNVSVTVGIVLSELM